MLKKIGLKLKEQNGFTLLELLAVIVILGIIAAIAIPSITNVINSSKDKAKVADALEIINAAKLYVADQSTAPTAITPTQLAPYLDRVKDNSFEIKVTYNPTSKTYSYEIKDHEAADVISEADTTNHYVTEKELSTWSN